MQELLFGVDHVGDVTKHAENLYDVARVVAPKGHDVSAHPVPRAIGVSESIAQLQNPSLGQMRRCRIHLTQTLLIVGMHQSFNRHGSEGLRLFGGSTEQVTIPRAK